MSSPASESHAFYSFNHTETTCTNRSTGVAPALSLTATGGIIVAANLFLFMFFVLLLCLCLRRKQCWGAIPAFVPANSLAAAEPAAPVSKVLDASAVRVLPSFVFQSAGSAEEGQLECSVCLTELADGENALRLPRCGHGFHLECIEGWLCSHSSCPLCRSPAVSGPPEVSDASTEPRGARLPVVVSGDGRSSRSQEDVILAIERPPPASPLPLPGLSSLRWLLTLGSRGVRSPRSPAEFDVEHGVGAPKTPAR